MFPVKSSSRINVSRDTITSALEKKINNHSLSKKTLLKLAEITNSTSPLSKYESENIFVYDIQIPSMTRSASVAEQLKNILPRVANPKLKRQIEKFISNCNTLTTGNDTATHPLMPKAEEKNTPSLSEKHYSGYEENISDILKNIVPMESNKLVELVKKRDETHIQMREKVFQAYNEKFGNEKLKAESHALAQKLKEYNPVIRNQELLYEATHGTGIHFKEKYIAPRRGEHCKLVSLSQLDAFFADRMDKFPVPFLKEHHFGVSLRQIAKEEGSLQGEILESTTLKKIAERIGYKVEMVRPENLTEFKDCLKNNVNDKGIIIFYALETDDLYHIYDDRFFASNRSLDIFEHASVISWYDSEREICTLNHWQEKYPGIPVELLYKSNQSLKETRAPEFYSLSEPKLHLSSDNSHPQSGKRLYKYHIEQNSQLWSVKQKKYIDNMKTITPARGTGFKGLVMLIEPDKNHCRWDPQQQYVLRKRNTNPIEWVAKSKG